MKQYATKFLKSVAAFFIVFPIVYIVIVAMLFDIPLNACVSLLISPFYYIVSFCAVAAGYGLWEMRRWSWYLFIAAQILITYENAVIAVSYAESHHKTFAFLIVVLLQAALVFRVGREIRVPYLFPRIRWWESNPRYRLAIPVTITRKNGDVCKGEILDLSLAGCFVKLRNDFTSDEALALNFNSYGYEVYCEGNVVWSALSAVTHPKGIGIKFG